MQLRNILFALIIGCGAQDDGYDDIGEVQQEITGFSTNSFGYGITTGTTHPNCLGNNAPSGQQCLVPESRTIFWCVDTQIPGRDAVFAADMNAIISGIGVGWTFVHNQDGAGCTGTFTPAHSDILINEFSSACPGGFADTNIDALVCSNPTVGGQLAESLPGSYNAMAGGIIHVDSDDISARAQAIGPASQVELIKQRLRRHGIGHQLAAFMGGGARTDVGASNSYTRRAVSPVMGAPALTVGERCRMNKLNETGAGAYSLSTGSCQND